MKPGWLFLLYALPARRGSQRVSLWRKLKKFGAVPFKTSAYLLPDEPTHYEHFQWLAKQIQDAGGDATLIRARKIEGLSQKQVEGLFNEARATEYGGVIGELDDWVGRGRKAGPEALERLRSRLAEIQSVDFFGCRRGQDAVKLLRKAEEFARIKPRRAPPLDRNDFQGRIWLTRPRPQIDRVGSAWLIRKFIDPKANFAFGANPNEPPGAVPYDMPDVELTHQGDDCTFETLLRRFRLEERPLRRIAEMIHDADLGDGKFGAHGAEGIDQVLRGLAELGWPDQKILEHGVASFEALYAQVHAS